MEDNRNLIFAIAISLAILVSFHFFYEVPRAAHLRQIQAQEQASGSSNQIAPKGDAPAAAVSALPEAAVKNRDEALAGTGAGAKRVPIDNAELQGTLSRGGIRFDDLTFKHYYTAIDHKDPVDLLSPSGTQAPYYASFGWVGDKGLNLPGDDTQWNGAATGLDSSHPITLTWDNGQGLTFARTIAIDAQYLFTVADHVTNHGTAPVTIYPYAAIARAGMPLPSGTNLEGAVAIAGGTLKDASFMSMTHEPTGIAKMLGHAKFHDQTYSSQGGWVGFSDKYWLVAAVPDQGQNVSIDFRHSKTGDLDHYQADYKGAAQTIPPGATIEYTSRLFAGAKVVKILNNYRDTFGIPKLDLAVDWGFLSFLTKPFFYGIHFLAKSFGNYGLGILGFTVVIRTLLFPLAYKSYREMSRMKDLTPQMNDIKERNAADKAAMQVEVMELYKKEKVNPLSGCVPMLLQIPIFLSLYKVLSVTIEMRQVPFYGWIHDLSAADPTNVFNLFGLIPYTLPLVPHLGAWPLILGLSMLTLQRMSPQPPDPVQARMMLITPLIFMFIMAKLPAGLVIYYSWSNIISIGQQWAIRKRYHKVYRTG